MAHSDGIRVDVTPPIASQLLDGLPSAPLVQFQASRYKLALFLSAV